MSEIPERKGTANVCTSGSSESVSSTTIGGAGAEREHPAEKEGPAAGEGPGMAAGRAADAPPKASFTWAKIAGIWEKRRKKYVKAYKQVKIKEAFVAKEKRQEANAKAKARKPRIESEHLGRIDMSTCRS